MSRYNYDNFVNEMRLLNSDEKKQCIDQIGVDRVLDYLNESVKIFSLIADRIEINRMIYDRAAGQKKVIEVLSLLPESERIKFIEKISLQFRAYLKMPELSRGESGRNLYFDMFNSGSLTTAWGGFRFVGIDYDWDNFLKRAGSYVRDVEESHFGCNKKECFDAISKFISKDSMNRFIDAIGPEAYAKINRQDVPNSISHTSAFFEVDVPFGVPLSNQGNLDNNDALLQHVVVPGHPILEGLTVPNHPLPVTGVVVEGNRSSGEQLKL